MKIKYLDVSLLVAIISIGDASLKSYPFFFSFFIFSYLMKGGRIYKRIAFPVFLFLLTAIFFSLIHAGNSFDYVSFIKLILNSIFLIVAVSYAASVSPTRAVKIMKTASIVFIAASFVQALFSVSSGGLWLLPLQLQSSVDSYAISDAAPVLFGDINKNIWASKTSIFMVIFLSCHYLIKGSRFVFFIVSSIGVVTLAYISSRTAQMAFIAFLTAMFFYHYWFVKRRRTMVLAMLVPFLFILLNVLDAVLRIDFGALANFSPDDGHMGDGLLARIIIWLYVFDLVGVKDFFIGNGILSFPEYTHGVFSENNPHNVFISIFMDFGFLTLVTYIYMLWRIFGGFTFSMVILAPFMVFANSQYIGYDSDLVIIWLFAFIVGAVFDRHALVKGKLMER